jgi:1-aminocyclopropane-1-carboxylate deaminase/D-cysteine desulfhydrase-like pyridoxal-dependent ACC family enzyme
MDLNDKMRFNDAVIQQYNDEHFKDAHLQLNILRLDKIHPVVSGNKWFKLKHYLQQAKENNHALIATFGGAFSNHILATAYACNKQNINCIGYIRGEKPEHFSETLSDAQALNMQLKFLSREDYTKKKMVTAINTSAFIIPEGGYGETGAEGAAEILQLVPNISIYDYIVCAAGTGTMLAGIANASLPHQQCIGISVMKNNISLQNETLLLVKNEAKNRIEILHDYHFGGYAKHTKLLIDFMNRIFTTHNLPLDFVYTAKALYALYHLAENKYFIPGSNILFIHSGGLQGNRSLLKESLQYF